MSEGVRCSFVRPDGRQCHYSASWSVHQEGTHPSEVFEVCEIHLPMVLDPAHRYTLFPPLSDLPEGRRV